MTLADEPSDASRAIRVLHVDDDRDFAELTATFLERESDSFVVETAANVEEGLESLDSGTFDCVVSDYEMPGTDGIEFLSTVRESHPDLPFVLFTGRGSEAVASDAISAGVTDYLQKERGTDQFAILRNRIENAVDRYRTRRALDERKRRLETLISNLPGIVYRCRNEPEWPMQFLAGECETLTGYPASALTDGDVVWGRDVLHPDDRAEIWESVQQALEHSDSFEVTYRIHTRDGDTRQLWERGRRVPSVDADETVIEGFITDITDRTVAETEIERNRILHSTLFEALPVGVLAEDANREVMAVNEQLVDLLGVDRPPADLVGEDCERFANRVDDQFVDSDRFVDRIATLIEEREPVDSEQIERTDGTTLERRYRPVDLPEGDGHLWVYGDVTEWRTHQRELERYERIVQASGDPVYTLDAEGRFTVVNDAFSEMTDYDYDELLGEHASLVVADDGIERTEDLIRSLLATDRDRGIAEIDVLTADGERIPCEANVSLLPFEETFRGTVGVVRDISDRVERERKLDQLRHRVQALMYTETRDETAQMATDAAADIIDAPLSGVHLLDEAGGTLAPGAVTASVNDWFPSTPSYDRDDDPGTRAAIVWDVFERDDPLWVPDTREYDPLSEPTVARSIILYPVGRHGVFIVSSPDAHAFDETDAALAELLATSLRTALDRVEREAELRQQRNELQRRNDRLDDFSRVVSHDLRNPLSVAEGHLELAREECQSDRLDTVARAHDRMGTLIDDLLALARHGLDVSDTEVVDLASLATTSWRSVSTEHARVDVKTGRHVLADRNRLQQLLENLFRNCVEHGTTGNRAEPGDSVEDDSTGGSPAVDDGVEQGPNETSLAAGDRRDDESGSPPDVVVTLGDLETGFYVEDDGPGIRVADRERVFETGYSTTEGGTGFGLPIVKQVADAHGWDVTVTDGSDGGARFEVRGVDVTDASG